MPSQQAIRYDPKGQRYVGRLEWTSGEPVSVQLIRAIANIEGVGVCDIETPLHAVIDTESLDRLFKPTAQPHRSEANRLQFTYFGYQITVESTGEMELVPGDSSAHPPVDSGGCT